MAVLLFLLLTSMLAYLKDIIGKFQNVEGKTITEVKHVTRLYFAKVNYDQLLNLLNFQIFD